MTNIAMFHHALGATPGLRAIANELREAGHDVTMVDLFDGNTFESIEAGVAYAEKLGLETIIERGVKAAAGLGDFVVIGFSLGVLPAQKLAQTNRGVIGAVLCDAAVPTAFFGGPWPKEVPAQLHLVKHDSFVEEDVAAAKDIAAAPNVDLFLYPGDGHLVADASARAHDPNLARQIIDRIVTFLDRTGNAPAVDK